MSTSPAISVYDDYGTLICPVCHSDNLHQIDVHAYWRKEDAKVGVVCASSWKGVVVTPGLQVYNPSSRRDGIRILFQCEYCHGDPSENTYNQAYALTIVQHKGLTYMQWEDRMYEPMEHEI